MRFRIERTGDVQANRWRAAVSSFGAGAFLDFQVLYDQLRSAHGWDQTDASVMAAFEQARQLFASGQASEVAAALSIAPLEILLRDPGRLKPHELEDSLNVSRFIRSFVNVLKGLRTGPMAQQDGAVSAIVHR